MGPKPGKTSSEPPGVPPEIVSQAQAVASSSAGEDQNRSSQASAVSNGNSSNTHMPSTHSDSRSTVDDGFDASNEASLPPPYEGSFDSVNITNEGLQTVANVTNDGRVNIRLDQKSNKLSNLLVPALRSQLKLQKAAGPGTPPPGYVPPSLGGVAGQAIPPPPPMNVVIHVVGSRGDVQPFVALGQVLQKTYHHRVRLATHPVFRDFVEENGLEFFSIGGDPAELMAFMVKNPGLMPGKDALRSGDIGKRRKGMYEIVRGCWRSCFEAGDGTGPAITDDQASNDFGGAHKPFVADAMIANPPSFAHVHIAEKLGIPLHLMFTMPWSPTQAFPHPLANIQSSNMDTSMTNFISYAVVEMMTWQGLGDIINRFRENVLGLEPIDLIRALVLVSRLKIPYTYCWSPALIPKPQDWGAHISVSGFYFLPLAHNYQPPEDLSAFLNSGPPPFYIGFGSIVLDDPNAMTRLIFDAVKKTGRKALVSKGWGGVGADELGIPDDVFMLGNVPHDWLFKHVSCVVHHGGAGTTAAGIALGKPTVVVPFFGDQPFWGAMIARAGAGPEPIPNKQLTAQRLADAIDFALRPETLERAQQLGSKISSEKGTDFGGKSFHDSLESDSLRCVLAPARAAVWRIRKTDIRLSGFAAAVLGKEGLIDSSELRLFRYQEYDEGDGPWEPISGAASALMGTVVSLMMGVADIPVDVFKALGRRSVNTDAAEAASGTGSASGLQNSRHDGVEQVADTENDQETSSLNKHEAIVAQEAQATSKEGERSPSTSRDGRSMQNRTISLGDALRAGKGIGRAVDAGIKSPMDFTLALAKGFHNAPRLYGDTSVRPHEHITGFQSGIKAAGKGFGLGFYDGISGLVTQPLEGAKKEGFSGLAKGFGKGIGGLVLKPAAAIWGLPGYTFKGLYKEVVKRLGSSVQNYIIAARVAQGYDEMETSTPEERLEIIGRWQALQVEATTQQSKKPKKSGAGASDAEKRRVEGLSTETVKLSLSDADDAMFDEAIKQSVAATSTGNSVEDDWIARAIRASVTELRQAASQGDGDEALQRAINASIKQAQGTEVNPKRLDDQRVRSLSGKGVSKKTQHNPAPEANPQNPSSNPAEVDTDDDENVKEAIKRSQEDSRFQRSNSAELDKAIAESLTSARGYDERNIGADEEERIVMDYVKRQSLLEDKIRENVTGKED